MYHIAPWALLSLVDSESRRVGSIWLLVARVGKVGVEVGCLRPWWCLGWCWGRGCCWIVGGRTCRRLLCLDLGAGGCCGPCVH
jgi:hypothetical protein